MSELSTIVKAREFIRAAHIDRIPIDLERYLAALGNVKLSVRYDLTDSEAGRTIPFPKKYLIEVNGNHTPERQRFTILHEIAHIVLSLPSSHGEVVSVDLLNRYASRPQEEVLCDVFAAECLLPFHVFRKDVEETDPSMDAIRSLAAKYEASLTSTASRYATVSRDLCASVLSENNVIRYVAMSSRLRAAGFWVDIGLPVPRDSVMGRLIVDSSSPQFNEIPSYHWTIKDNFSRSYISEEVAILKGWDQAIGLLWFEEDVEPAQSGRNSISEGEDELLSELDGTLPWPSGRKRR